MHAQEGPPPVVIDLAEGTRWKLLAGVLAAGTFGLCAVVAPFTGGVSGGRAAEIVALVIGSILLLIALGPLLMWKVITRPRSLVIEQAGIRWDDPQGAPWAVVWPELAAIAVSRTVNRSTALVRLDLFPADQGFRERHPEMEHLWEFHRVRNGYRVPFGQEPSVVPKLDAALRQFGGVRYQGVRDEGFTVGLI